MIEAPGRKSVRQSGGNGFGGHELGVTALQTSPGKTPKDIEMSGVGSLHKPSLLLGLTTSWQPPNQSWGPTIPGETKLRAKLKKGRGAEFARGGKSCWGFSCV